jgi:hypothetical protein
MKLAVFSRLVAAIARTVKRGPLARARPREDSGGLIAATGTFDFSYPDNSGLLILLTEGF